MSEHLLPLHCGFMWFGFIRNALANQSLVTGVVTDLLMVNGLRLVWLLEDSFCVCCCKVMH